MWPSWQAMYSAVAPEPSVFGSFTSAPPANSATTSAARPCRAASISGVSPSSICACARRPASCDLGTTNFVHSI